MDSFIREVIPYKSFNYLERYFNMIYLTYRKDRKITTKFGIHFMILAIEGTIFIYCYVFHHQIWRSQPQRQQQSYQTLSSSSLTTLNQLITGDYVTIAHLQRETYLLFSGICALSAYLIYKMYYQYDSVFLNLLHNILIDGHNDFFIPKQKSSPLPKQLNLDVNLNNDNKDHDHDHKKMFVKRKTQMLKKHKKKKQRDVYDFAGYIRDYTMMLLNLFQLLFIAIGM